LLASDTIAGAGKVPTTRPHHTVTIRVFNTMQQSRVPLEPLSPGNRGHVCGPTVTFFIHIGNAHVHLFDTIVRYLRNFRGFEVRYVRNFTDVDDKIIRRLGRACGAGGW
jgi:cysteinyl-tRNA synthetase